MSEIRLRAIAQIGKISKEPEKAKHFAQLAHAPPGECGRRPRKCLLKSKPKARLSYLRTVFFGFEPTLPATN
jgi:hypothetical protein